MGFVGLFLLLFFYGSCAWGAWQLLRIDRDISSVEELTERGAELRIGAADQLHVLGALDRPADRLAHPTRGPRHRDPDHAATTVTGESASSKRA